MDALKIENEISFQLSYFVTTIKAFSAINRTDLNRVAQNILVPIFKEIYGYSQLRNLDVGTSGNFPSIDLADDIARVAIQVTSTPGIEKVKHTLNQFLKERDEFDPPLSERYDRLIIYILTEKQKTYSKPSIDNVLEERFSFDVSKDIWDYQTLLTEIEELPLTKKEAILEILKNQSGITLSQIALKGLIQVPEGSKTEYLVGRESLLEQVHIALSSKNAAQQMVILTGMGGIGKTQVALEYVLRYQENYSRILWSSGASEADFLDSLKRLACTLIPSVRHMEDASYILEELKRWMNDEVNKDWLLVIDGADFQKGWTPGRFKAVLPIAKQGKLLITSQYQEFSAFPNAQILPVNPLSLETAVDFVLKFAGREITSKEDKSAVQKLAQGLGCLPIALEQAGAYIKNIGLSFQDYNELLHKYGLPVLPKDFDHATDYDHSIQTVCQLAFEAVQKRSPQAIILLEFIAFLSAESNCIAALTMLAIASDDPLTIRLPGIQDKTLLTSSFLNLTNTLQKYSLLTVNHEKGTIRVHRIVQMAMRNFMSKEELHARLISWSTILELFLRAKNQSSRWNFIEGWFAHARSVAYSVLAEEVNNDSVAAFLENISDYLNMRAHYQEAIQFATQAVKIREFALSPTNSKSSLAYANSLNILGAAYLRNNKSSQAIEILDEAINILKSKHPEELSSLVLAMVNKAIVYLERGEINEAELIFEQIMSNTTLKSAANVNLLAEVLKGMAQIANKRKDYETGANLIEKVVTALENESPADMYTLANAYDSFGVMLAKCERFDEAQENYEKAFE
ncbi:MAG: SMEK domain-containing protein, partial [Prochloraceae cyanobacterium]